MIAQDKFNKTKDGIVLCADDLYYKYLLEKREQQELRKQDQEQIKGLEEKLEILMRIVEKNVISNK